MATPAYSKNLRLKKSKTILLRVKGEIFAPLLKAYFEQWGFEVVQLPRQVNCLPELPGQEPVLIVMDLTSYPPAPGPESELLGGGHALPLLLLVCHPNGLPLHAYRLSGVRRYACLAKPCLEEELKKSLENLPGCILPALPGMAVESEKASVYSGRILTTST